MDLPALVTEVPLELAGNAWLCVGGQAAAESRIEVVDRLQQADVTHLHQILGWLGAVPVPLDAQPHQAAMTADQQFARRSAPLARPRQRPEDSQQLVVL